jgi:DNA-binding NtrC family response regulator
MRTKQRRQAPWPASSHPSDLRAAEPENDDRVLRAELGLVGSSPAFVDAFVQARRFANCMAPVMIRGQTGNGKELFARAIHCLGARAAGPFIPINCGAIPDALLESELFGHVRGAFTDARGDRAGLVALAGGGTLFLDEVDSLSAKAQVTLLRFLQDHEYRPVGAGTIAHADVRVLSATNADVDAALANGVFRSDLLFRLDVLALTLPPLAQRREDIVVLARHFLGRFAGVYSGQAPQLDADAAQWLAAQPWPGNVRQLENLMHRAYVLGSGGRIRRADLTPAIDCAEPMASGLFEGGLKEARRRWLREFEHAYLQRLLAQTHGNVTEAAQRSGMERRAMGRLLVRNGIDKGRFR